MNDADVAAGLLSRGFIEVTELNGMSVGARVRHRGEQWFEAHEHGTGTIERIFHKPESSWSRTYRRPDVELIVKRDKPKFGADDTHSFVADYHIELIGAAA